MADFEAIRHALSVARDRGFAEVSLTDGEVSFKAVLEPVKIKARSKASSSPENDDEIDEGPKLAEIQASLVGYYQRGSRPLAVGSKVAKGDVVAVISQLGIANDLESKVDGEVVEILVGDNEPVMYGQVIARIKEQ